MAGFRFAAAAGVAAGFAGAWARAGRGAWARARAHEAARTLNVERNNPVIDDAVVDDEVIEDAVTANAVIDVSSILPDQNPPLKTARA